MVGGLARASSRGRLGLGQGHDEATAVHRDCPEEHLRGGHGLCGGGVVKSIHAVLVSVLATVACAVLVGCGGDTTAAEEDVASTVAATAKTATATTSSRSELLEIARREASAYTDNSSDCWRLAVAKEYEALLGVSSAKYKKARDRYDACEAASKPVAEPQEEAAPAPESGSPSTAEKVAAIDGRPDDSATYDRALRRLSSLCEVPVSEVADIVVRGQQVAEENGVSTNILGVIEGAIDSLPPGAGEFVKCNEIVAAWIALQVP